MTNNLLNRINYYKNLILFQITLCGIIIFALFKIHIAINNNIVKTQTENNDLKISLKKITNRVSYLNDFNEALLKDTNKKIKHNYSIPNYECSWMSGYEDKIYNIQKKNCLNNPININISPSFVENANIDNNIVNYFPIIKQNIEFAYYTTTTKEFINVMQELFELMPEYSSIDSVILNYTPFKKNSNSNESEYESTKFSTKIQMSTNIIKYNHNIRN